MNCWENSFSPQFPNNIEKAQVTQLLSNMVLQYRTISFLQQKSLWKSKSDFFYFKKSSRYPYNRIFMRVQCTLPILFRFSTAVINPPRPSTQTLNTGTIHAESFSTEYILDRGMVCSRFDLINWLISLDPPYHPYSTSRRMNHSITVKFLALLFILPCHNITTILYKNEERRKHSFKGTGSCDEYCLGGL